MIERTLLYPVHVANLLSIRDDIYTYVGALEALGLEEITRNDLVVAGLVRASDALVKILGEGELSKKITVTADKFSASAVKKIEDAGGKAVVNAPVSE